MSVTNETYSAAVARIGELEAMVDSKQTEIQRLNSLLNSYRTLDGKHERMVNNLFQLMTNEDFDYAMDIVRDEYRAIHGPE